MLDGIIADSKRNETSMTAAQEGAVAAEIVLFTKIGGSLSKHIRLDAEGKLVSDSSACMMSEGHAERVRLTGPSDLASLIGKMPPECAIALGRLRPDLPDKVDIATARQVRGGCAEPGAVSRTQANLIYAVGEPALALLDFDRKGMPQAVAQTIAAQGGFWPTLMRMLPKLADVAHVRRASTSAGLYDRRSGEAVGGAGGEHVYILVQDGADIPRFLRDLHDRCWLHGFGWYLVGGAGQLLERSIVDRMVGGPERLVFEGAPLLEPPLAQDRIARAPAWSPGHALDTRIACPPLSQVERARLEEFKKGAAAALRPEAARVRADASQTLAQRIVERDGLPLATALRIAEARHRGILLPGVDLVFDDPAIGTVTVANVLDNPERFTGETLADPLEGIAYGRCKAMVMRRLDGSLWIHSFAHGRTSYDLKRNAAMVEAALHDADPTAVVDTYIRLLHEAELEADEEDRIAKVVCKLSGTSIRPLKARIRQARQQWAQEAAEQRAPVPARPHHERTRLPAPAPDDERTPVLLSLDEMLVGVADSEPPMRNADRLVVEIRSRQPWRLHQLTDAGAEAEEMPEKRLPAPEEPLITALDPVGLGLLVERHVEYYRPALAGSDEPERPVALPSPFLQAYLNWQHGRLPVVRAVVTAPVVTRSGCLLAGTGLDRDLQLVFRIEPQVLALVPQDPDAITDAEVVEALRFLIDEWLCDVATDFAGRVVLLAYALTIIERVLLPERPAFFVTAGQRGGGKTMALVMVIVAILGRRPPAAAWSPSAEERRKTLLACLGEGVATLVWDNIERGTAISCPSIEKALTAAEYTDRVLGASRSATVPSTTVLAFTGNNIAPKGDMASRSLVCRLEVDRPDPENRSFRHADPVLWTLDYRSRILRALYTLLRWNPQIRTARTKRAESKTRFKTWWDLIGAPLELASMLAAEAQAAAAAQGETLFRCVPEVVDFGAMFAAGEAEDEETCSMETLISGLHSAFGERLFTAADLASRLQPGFAEMGGPPDPKRFEEAQAIRAALEGATGKALPPMVTPHAVGKRLQALVGRPVSLGTGRVGKVEKAHSSHTAHTYRVVITGTMP